MCLLGLALGVHPSVPFVCVHNRDESMLRPTAPPSLEDGFPFLGGVDLKAGGTWMGLDVARGTFAALTNFRSKVYPNPSKVTTSRGKLLQRLLVEPSLVEATDCVNLGDAYTGFTMISAQLGDSAPGQPAVKLLSNRPQPSLDTTASTNYAHNRMRVYDVPCGVHSFSNSHFNDITWPKVAHARRGVERVVKALPQQSEPLTNEQVLALAKALAAPMSRVATFEDALLPDVSFTSIAPEMERELQRRVLIPKHTVARGASYGTRAQTVVIKTTDAIHMLYRITEAYPVMSRWLHFRRPLSATVAEKVSHGAEAGVGRDPAPSPPVSKPPSTVIESHCRVQARLIAALAFAGAAVLCMLQR